MECEEIGHQEEQMEISTDTMETFEHLTFFGNGKTFSIETLPTINPNSMEIEENENTKITSLDPSRQSKLNEMESLASSANTIILPLIPL